VVGSSVAKGEQFNGRDAKDQHCKSYQIVFEPNTHDNFSFFLSSGLIRPSSWLATAR
jgi:hypothetical protein